VMSEATARIDAEYVMAVGQPGPHGIEPARVARGRLGLSVRALVLESPHATVTVIPTPSKGPNQIGLHEPTPRRNSRHEHGWLFTGQ
jgi:hypothetical protein